MALQIWMPMVSDFNNQGLQNSTITNNSVTLDNNGKLGKCGKFTGSNYISGTINLGDSIEYTLACWVKPPDVSAGNKQIVAIASNSGWVNCRATMFYRQNTAEFIATLSNGTDSIGYTMGMTATPNVWQHIAVTFKNKTMIWYSNGVVQKTLTTTIDPKFSDITAFGIGGASNGAEKFTGYINDVRIYDHALSPKEIEILSRGLVCHYPLSDVSNQTPNNVATYPTFDTSSGHGGWNHWGDTGNLGHYSQNTNSQYIFRLGQTYSHCFSDESTATAPYLLYQVPSFSGGYRSLCAIIKEKNSAEIKESIVYPVWNAAVSGSIPTRKWTSIIPLGNGFYLCKVEGFQQDGSNNLVGIYVNAGYTVYVSEFYIENDRTVCSDFFYPSTTVYDTSGYQYNGTISGSLTTSNDTARYSASTYIPKAGYIQHPNALGADNANQEWTCCAWVKLTNTDSNQQLNNFNLNNIIRSSTTPLLYINSGSHDYYMYGSVALSTDTWTHIAFVFKNSDGTRNVYINGELKNSYGPNKDSTPAGIPSTVTIFGGNFDGYVSDYREYATALSATQVAELYNTAVSVANNGTLMGYELVEV